MTLSPRESGKLIAEHASHVSLHTEGVKNITQEILKSLKSKELHIDNFLHHELHPQVADEKAIDWLFLADTLNFCFWSADSTNKWTVTFNGKPYSGYFALCAAINRAIKEGIPMTDPKYYVNITLEQLEKICRSDNSVKAPLLNKRVECLHEVGKVLLDKYDGTFVTCVKESGHSAQKLLNLIVSNFSCYRDEANFKDHKVAIYKRAQILIGDIWSCFRGKGLGRFDDIDSITMFADYRIPQVLVHFGVMTYSDELMKKLKEGKVLENGSEDEVEIRGCSIYAVDLIVDEVKKLLKAEKDEDTIVNAVLVDQFLWDYRRKNADMLEHIPFHRTLSVFY